MHPYFTTITTIPAWQQQQPQVHHPQPCPPALAGSMISPLQQRYVLQPGPNGTIELVPVPPVPASCTPQPPLPTNLPFFANMHGCTTTVPPFVASHRPIYQAAATMIPIQPVQCIQPAHPVQPMQAHCAFQSSPNKLVARTYDSLHNGVGLVIGNMYTATVKRYNSTRRFGFLRTDCGVDVFVHHSSIAMSGYRTINVGDRVQFTAGIDQGTLQAINVVPEDTLSHMRVQRNLGIVDLSPCGIKVGDEAATLQRLSNESCINTTIAHEDIDDNTLSLPLSLSLTWDDANTPSSTSSHSAPLWQPDGTPVAFWSM